ncbi:MAG: lipopolysaccharide heptosyltransferase II [Candidatus Omnitrophota bacterium]|nr:lipopolysaccharide heptosyltransferase II [Candidatus Omnitrophota bacterium]
MNRILVTLPNWYGETLFATPWLRALRQQRPRAFIATLGWPRCREILLHNPHIDELLDYDEHGAHRSLIGKWRLVATLRARRFDTAFILRKSLSRTMLVAAAGIPARVGFANPKSNWLLTQRVPAAGGPRHKASTYWPLLEAVGLCGLPGPYEYTVSDDERQAARQWQSAQRIEHGRPVVVLHPGANWPHKRWAPVRFAALGDRLTESQRVHVVVTGGPADQALADALKQSMRHPATVVAGQTTLRQLAALLEQARLVIANDTGILHLAAALQRPVVALYGPTSPALTGPLGDPQWTIVLHHPDCCPSIPCYQPDRPPHTGMNAITVEEAYQAACQLLGKGSSEFGIRSSELKRSA